MMRDVQGFVKFNFWLKENAFKRIEFKYGNAEDICQIVDLSTAKFGPPPKAVTESSKIFKKHCPESNGVNIFVNVPSMVVGVFKLCQKFIDKRTFEKIRILGPGEHRALFELVRPESLPVFLGGLMLDNGEASLSTPCNIVEVTPGVPQVTNMLKIDMAAAVRWELRVCNLDIDFAVR